MTTATTIEATVSKAACAYSPTGSHHWVIGAPGGEMSGQCKPIRLHANIGHTRSNAWQSLEIHCSIRESTRTCTSTGSDSPNPTAPSPIAAVCIL